ncbi:penicillin acylase family protein [Azospirillum thermophilum]|uniref:penicillin acylase family protein n=1 Tax=Azospirillum thermophilum TaxID=2202148 RepID=UPI001FE3C0FD|nr:penicillin acylase family protein [Azospirillum thermophilum]
MIRRLFALLSALLLILLLAVLGVGGFLLWLWLDQPATSGAAAGAGMEKPVEVLRDARGIPHIFAAGERDAYRALGYVHAQDRLWQMEMTRRAGAGRLAELVGTRLGDWALRLDRSMRTLGLHRAAEQMEATLSPEAKAAFTAYAEGVNAYLKTRREPLPIEFQLLHHEPEPWRVADSLVWAKLMALQLSGNYREEGVRARLLQTLSPQQVEDLFPADPPGSPVTLAAAFTGEELTRALALLPELGFDTASNEWVLDGSRTTTGKPILANDPHLGLEAPILWYLARIVTPGFTVAGATVPGVPLHILGHNGRVAWGFTTTHSDTQDLFIEKIDPADPTRYLVPGGSRPFASRTEAIRIAGAAEERLTVRETRHGPVVSTLLDGAGGAPPDHVMALAFPGLAGDDSSAEALYRLNHAADAAAVREALRLHVAPQQNVVYADTAGTVGFLAPARVPIRRSGDGRVPVPGWTGEHDWTGFIPFDELPQAVNPPSGQFVNANNAVVGPGYRHHLAADWPDPSRARRIVEMLGTGSHSVEQVAAQQMDAVSLPARELLPALLELASTDGRAGEALALLKGWDGRMDRNRPEPLIFESWQRELVRVIFADELGEAFPSYWDLRPAAVLRALRPPAGTGGRGWCDDVTTPTRESCKDMVDGALAVALSRIQARQGPDMRSWRWGTEHRAALNHRLLGAIPLVKDLLDLSIETDGGFFTVNRGTTRIRDSAAPFAHVHGAGYRAVYDLADLDNSRFVIATGQSGNPFSRHWGTWFRPGGTGARCVWPATVARWRRQGRRC